MDMHICIFTEYIYTKYLYMCLTCFVEYVRTYLLANLWTYLCLGCWGWIYTCNLLIYVVRICVLWHINICIQIYRYICILGVGSGGG